MSNKLETMTRAVIVDSVRDSLPNLSTKEAINAVNSIIEIMHETLAGGENIKIFGFGNFTLKDKNARIGRNPQTGEPIKIRARRVLGFKANDSLKSILKSNDQ